MSRAIFQPVPLTKILQHNIPPGMHFAFALETHSVSMRVETDIFDEAVRWCAENFVERFPCDRVRWSPDQRYFFRIFFRSETDAAAFKLRWC